MYKIMQRLLVILPVAFLALALSTGAARAQSAPAAAATSGCDPCVSHSPAYRHIEDDPAYKIRMKYCAAHPEKCGPADMGMSPAAAKAMAAANLREAQQDPSYYQKPEPGHTNTCFHDPKAPPDKFVCIPDTWSWPNAPEYGHCYSNPKNPSEQRCAPTDSN